MKMGWSQQIRMEHLQYTLDHIVSWATMLKMYCETKLSEPHNEEQLTKLYEETALSVSDEVVCEEGVPKDDIARTKFFVAMFLRHLNRLFEKTKNCIEEKE